MALTIVLNGVSYSIPEPGDTGWGQSLTDYFQNIPSGVLQKSGGTFTLTNEVDFGASFGLKSLYYKSRTANGASAGQIRLANADTIKWRNIANSSDLALAIDGSNNLTFNGTVIQGAISVTDTSTIDLTLTGSALSAAIIAGSITNSFINASAAIAYSKLNLAASIVNADISASAAIAYSKLNLSTSIVNADVSASAAIAFSKLASLTSAHILVGSAGNVATDVAVTGDISITNAGVTAYSGTVPLNKGGTGQTTKAAAFDALSPMSASGDIIYGGASGTGTRLAKGSDGTFLSMSGGLPVWAAQASSPTQSYELNNLGLSVTVSSNIITVAVKQSDGTTDPASGTGAVKVGFRDVTSANGDYNERSITAALSLTLGTAASLGCASTVPSTFYVYLFDNAGTITVGAAQVCLDEASVQSSSTTSTSNRLIYQASALSSKPVRVIGRFTATWTSGVGWSAISEVALKPFQTNKVKAVYYSTSAATYPTVETILNFDTKEIDTHNSVSPGAGWVFTAPKSADYLISAQASTGNVTGEATASIICYKNTSTSVIFSRACKPASSGGQLLQPKFTKLVSLSAGDTVSIKATSGGVALSYDGASSNIFISIVEET